MHGIVFRHLASVVHHLMCTMCTKNATLNAVSDGITT
jgi:hypothetical protein